MMMVLVVVVVVAAVAWLAIHSFIHNETRLYDKQIEQMITLPDIYTIYRGPCKLALLSPHQNHGPTGS